MRKKPNGAKYRNLTARGSTIYYQRVSSAGGQRKRTRVSLETSSWEEAAERREAYERKLGVGRVGSSRCDVPSFADFAQVYLKEDTRHLARTTLSDRVRELRHSGPLLSRLGDYGLDQLTPAVLRRWWADSVDAEGRSIKTGRNLLDTISSVLSYALELELIEENPVSSFRAVIARKARTQRGRAEAADKAQPIEEPEQIQALLGAAQKDGLRAYIYVLLQLDAGLRVGEALGLRWRSIEWGEGKSYRGRALRIGEARSRGGPAGLPKSGRARRVDLSLRLRCALEELMFETQPDASACVVAGLHPDNFRKYQWRDIVTRAGLGHRRPKDLRDTFASQLLTAGIQLGYISGQLGHADVSVTARHYARWCESKEYRAAMSLQPGEVPADLIARLATAPRKSDPTRDPTPPLTFASTRSNGAGAVVEHVALAGG